MKYFVPLHESLNQFNSIILMNIIVPSHLLSKTGPIGSSNDVVTFHEDCCCDHREKHGADSSLNLQLISELGALPESTESAVKSISLTYLHGYYHGYR